jgi:hypothetical protein
VPARVPAWAPERVLALEQVLVLAPVQERALVPEPE